MTRRELRENVFKMLFRVEFFDAGELPEAAWPKGRIGHFLEIHIEQGPVLDGIIWRGS